MNYIKRKEDESTNTESVFSFSGLSSTALSVLKERGFDSIEKVQSYLYLNVNTLNNPFLFNDMAKAVNLIKETIKHEEKIVIYGDYDVDGISSCTLMYLGLKGIGANCSCYIPQRETEGYGLNCKALDFIKEKYGASLVITVDCGITSVNEVKYAYEKGMKMIVSDHHEAKEEWPSCEAVLDAKVPGENYPFKELCGTGVAFKIIEALTNYQYAYQFLDFVAFATIADVVSLTDENRTLVRLGLDVMNNYPHLAFKALKKNLNDSCPITASKIAFQYAPIINACGRIDDPRKAVIFMTLNDEEAANNQALFLINNNKARQEIESRIYSEAIQKLATVDKSRKTIVLFEDSWNAGVIGIVASKLCEKYNLPTILLSYNKEMNLYKGSGRSISGINIFECLGRCKSLLQFGGHEMAAGISVLPEKMFEFIEEFDNVVKENSDESVFEKTIFYDKEIKLGELKPELLAELELFEPTGMGNPKPKFLVCNAMIKNVRIFGSTKNHYSCEIYDETASIPSVAFNQMPGSYNDFVDAVIVPSFDTYSNSFQGMIVHSKPGKKSSNNLLNEYTNYATRPIPENLDVIISNNKKIEQFNSAGIFTTTDLLNYFPKKYLDYRNPKSIIDTVDKEDCAIIATVKSVKISQKGLLYCQVVDEYDKRFMVCWFNQSYLMKKLVAEQKYIFCGQVKIQNDGFIQMYPKFFSTNIDKYRTLCPVYKKIRGISEDYLNETISKTLASFPNTDYLEKNIVKDFGLICEYDAIRNLHHPNNETDVLRSQRRKVFDELFRFSYILKDKTRDFKENSSFNFNSLSLFEKFRQSLPYELTDDQNNVISEMIEYIRQGKRLNGLLQGDVGSGKTIVAFFMMLAAFENKFQSCLIAPTEVLAKQHYADAVKMLVPFGIKVEFLSGGLKVREKKSIVKRLAENDIDIVIGTHAVIQDSVVFNNLGLVIIDEQHRFGVKQREKLLNIGTEAVAPHVISMSATPIPRTLSMALYGDYIQIFNIKTKPAGRKPVQTIKMFDDNEVYSFIYNEIQKGRQAYIVCPLIEDSDSEKMSSVSSVSSSVKDIEQYFSRYPDVKISDISGKMKSEEIADEIRRFESNETNILISTTIIEVGVNIPNASVMVIKNSERFGLAQAHQLRGRVGRGDHQSYCILQPSKEDIKADILCNTTDGFVIAQEDLKLRGTGDYIGTSQTGNNATVMLMLSEPDLYKNITELVKNLYEDPLKLARYDYLREQ